MPNDGTDSHASQYIIESDFIAVSSTQKKLYFHKMKSIDVSDRAAFPCV